MITRSVRGVMCCSVLQYVEVSRAFMIACGVWCSVLQCAAVCCSVLQCVEVSRAFMIARSVWCGVFAVCCSVLQSRGR